jgi:hypothetical protein
MGRELSLGAAEDGKKTRKRTIWTEQTEASAENKGVSASWGHERPHFGDKKRHSNRRIWVKIGHM